MQPEAFIVPHTHWDREWYRPFQAFRYRLVDLVEQVLRMIEGIRISGGSCSTASR
jgi:Glycosyl hydrolases family 38 N-terminal domain.